MNKRKSNFGNLHSTVTSTKTKKPKVNQINSISYSKKKLGKYGECDDYLLTKINKYSWTILQ